MAKKREPTRCREAHPGTLVNGGLEVILGEGLIEGQPFMTSTPSAKGVSGNESKVWRLR